MTVDQHSLEAYDELKTTGKKATQEDRIVSLLAKGKPMTARMIAKELTLEARSVGARLRGLELEGIVKKDHEAKCPLSGITSWWWALHDDYCETGACVIGG
jgi:predicted ArsR family transcriptional regulator